MAGSSADIEALLCNGNDPDDPTPGQLPAIFRDIVGRLNAKELSYAVIGRIALTLHEQARYISNIEIVARLEDANRAYTAAVLEETRERFAPYMDRCKRSNAISVSLRSCSDPIEDDFLAEAVTCTWFGIAARLASAEHLLWLWCRSSASEHRADACALIQGGRVDLQRVQRLLREADDGEASGNTRLRLAIGDAVLSSVFCLSRFMEERRARLESAPVPVWRLLQQSDRGNEM